MKIPPSLSRLTGEVLRDERTRKDYSLAQCLYRVRPRLVVLPGHEEDVLAVLEAARGEGIPVTSRGAGTAMAGQCLGSGMIMDFTRHLNRTLEICVEEKWARVEPGVVLSDLNRELAPHGLRFAPDPASQDFCTLGGMIANNAGGPRSVLFGPTRDHVLSLKLALAGGEVWETRSIEPGELGSNEGDDQVQKARWLANLVETHRQLLEQTRPRVRRFASGYDLLGAVRDRCVNLAPLVVGSEGTLATILEAKLRLTPLPGAVATALVSFRDLEEMGEGVLLALDQVPSAVETLDRSFLDLIREAGQEDIKQLPRDVEAVLILEVEGADAQEVENKMEVMRHRLADQGPATGFLQGLEFESRRRIWEIRKSASPILTAREGRRRSARFIEDACVPTPRLPRFLGEIRKLLARHHLEAAVFGHAGDALLHVNPLIDPAETGIEEKIERVTSEHADLVLGMQGSLSGEHGDGRVRTPYLRRAFGEAANLFAQVKRSFDPQNILNPGIKVHDGRSRMTDHMDLGPRASQQDGPPWKRREAE